MKEVDSLPFCQAFHRHGRISMGRRRRWHQLDHSSHPILGIDTTLAPIQSKEDTTISSFLQNLYLIPFVIWDIVIEQYWEVTGVLIEEPIWKRIDTIEEGKSSIKIVYISLWKTLKINSNLTPDQEQQLLQVFTNHTATFSWDYVDIKVIDLYICKHHIYIKDEATPITQPQRRMNYTL